MATALTSSTHPQHATLITAARVGATPGQPRRVRVPDYGTAKDLAASLAAISGTSAITYKVEPGYSTQHIVEWTES